MYDCVYRETEIKVERETSEVCGRILSASTSQSVHCLLVLFLLW